MKVDIVFNEAGQATGMRHHWMLDEFFSAYAVEGIEKDAKGNLDQKGLDALNAEMLGNLRRLDYFIKLESKGTVPKLADARPTSLIMKGIKLDMKFIVPFEKPVSIQENALTYSVYDPEFYIELLHVEGDNPVELVNRPDGCKWDLVPPDPDPDLAAYANSLGRNETGTEGLGSFFAEKVTITCPKI